MLMKLRSFMRRNNEKGFTLVELIIVMAILAILAGLAAPRFTGVLSDAKTKADEANLRMLQDAVDLYHASEGEYPTNLNDLVGDYIKEVPEINEDGKTWNYNSTTGIVSIEDK